MLVALGLTGAVAAQTASQSQTQQQPPAQSMAQDHAVTVEGCLVREKDVPGREPNVAERAGVAEDYILTNVKFLKGSPHASAGAAVGTAGATGTSGTTAGATSEAGTHAMAGMKFEVRGIDEARLQPFVGQRVEIEGKIDPADFPERVREKTAGEPAGDLPELQGTVIRKSSNDEPCVVK
jgi:hypothetical protein